MIIDNVKKLLEFLKNKPVSVVNNCLDCTKEFALTQVTYSYLAVIAIIAASTPSFIIHSSESNSQISNFQPVIQSTNGQRRPVLRSKVGTLIRVASSSTAQVGKIARYIKPTPENIRDKVPITVILSYSLSRPNYVKFMFSLKAYNVYGQLPLIEASASEDDHVTYGLYADSYTLVRPAIPVLKRQIVEGELYGKALEFVNSLAQRFTEDKEDEDDSTPTLAQEVLEEVMNKSQSAQSETPERQSANSNSGIVPLGRLFRTHSTYPAQRRSRSSSVPRNQVLVNERAKESQRKATFKRFKNHLFSSIYFKIDVLKTFAFRIEQ